MYITQGEGVHIGNFPLISLSVTMYTQGHFPSHCTQAKGYTQGNLPTHVTGDMFPLVFIIITTIHMT